jgi:hypothetical protein
MTKSPWIYSARSTGTLFGLSLVNKTLKVLPGSPSWRNILQFPLPRRLDSRDSGNTSSRTHQLSVLLVRHRLRDLDR